MEPTMKVFTVTLRRMNESLAGSWLMNL
jgi:hypothetical protein